jgi:hypothetical protein
MKPNGSTRRATMTTAKTLATKKVSVELDGVRQEVVRRCPRFALLTYEDQDLARRCGLIVAEIAVDNWLPDF